MKASEGEFIQLNLCNSICAVLGQEVNDRALGTYIWKQHVSKDFINPAVKGGKKKKRRKKKNEVERPNYGGMGKFHKGPLQALFNLKK